VAFIVVDLCQPLIPTVFVVAVGISSQRLRKTNVSCTQPESLLVAGSIDAAFFDKTGTLTRQGMSFISIECADADEDVARELCIRGMAVCHTLTCTKTGELIGTQIDKASFESTGAKLHGSHVEISGETYKVLKTFDFDNSRQTQSVVVRDAKGARFVFVKGSPEAVKAMCLPYTLPESFEESARVAAKSAIYQLAIAFKSYNSNDNAGEANRDEVEEKLFFGGFLNFRNVLRDESHGVLQELADANIPTAIITGDNVLVGVAIAREAGMLKAASTLLVGKKISKKKIEWVNFDTNALVAQPIEEILDSSGDRVDLATTGEAWNVLCDRFPNVGDIATRIRVFGRCTPSDKVSVVSHFIDSGRVTLMCGDGQNDCGSLRTAHVGIALSNTEASIVAPFTALDKSVTAVTKVLREGRCATASALASYSFYILYGQLTCPIDFLGARLVLNLSECCWVALVVSAITMAFSLPLSKAASTLTVRRPAASLLCVETVLSIVGHILLNYIYLGIAFAALGQQDWFRCRTWGQSEVGNFQAIGDSYESSVLFLMTIFQTIGTAMTMNFGYTFRQPWAKNYVFVCLSSFFMLCVFFITLYPSKFSCVFRVNCSNEVSCSIRFEMPRHD
jgi:magnesium-transporting ATPase (P-type)